MACFLGTANWVSSFSSVGPRAISEKSLQFICQMLLSLLFFRSDIFVVSWKKSVCFERAFRAVQTKKNEQLNFQNLLLGHLRSTKSLLKRNVFSGNRRWQRARRVCAVKSKRNSNNAKLMKMCVYSFVVIYWKCSFVWTFCC